MPYTFLPAFSSSSEFGKKLLKNERNEMRLRIFPPLEICVRATVPCNSYNIIWNGLYGIKQNEMDGTPRNAVIGKTIIKSG